MKKRIERFLQKAYGMDKLSMHLYYVSIFTFIVSLFTKVKFLNIISMLGLLLSLFRSLSSNYSQRRKENKVYLRYYHKVFSRLKVIYLNIRNFRRYKYTICKTCGQQLRIPKNQGAISVTCPKCRHKFDYKS